jgi:hypothetical protein
VFAAAPPSEVWKASLLFLAFSLCSFSFFEKVLLIKEKRKKKRKRRWKIT